MTAAATAVRELTGRNGWQHDAVEVRSLALAGQHPMLRGAVKLYGRNPQGETVYRVLSDRTWTYAYSVRYDAASDCVTGCDCKAGEHNAPCYHKGIVREVIQRGKLGMYGCEW